MCFLTNPADTSQTIPLAHTLKNTYIRIVIDEQLSHYCYLEGLSRVVVYGSDNLHFQRCTSDRDTNKGMLRI